MAGCCGKKKEPKMVDQREVKHKTSRLSLWLIWLVLMVVSAGYCALSFVSFKELVDVAKYDHNNVQNNVLWAVLAASFIGPFVVASFFFFGTFVLLKKTIGGSGFTYSFGALQWSALWMAVIVLQSSVALHGQHRTMDDYWEEKLARPGAGPDDNFPWGKSDTALVTATYVIGYILCICYAALFFIMFALRKATKKFKTGQAEAPLSSPSSAHGHSYRHSGRQGYSHGHGEAVPPAAAAAPAAAPTYSPEKKKGGFFQRFKHHDNEAATGGAVPAAAGASAGHPQPGTTDHIVQPNTADLASRPGTAPDQASEGAYGTPAGTGTSTPAETPSSAWHDPQAQPAAV